MRFERLHIPAFGPFTNLDLNFPLEGGDLHIVYGSNETGKSSLLRALRDLLFGIHGQSPDNFLHDYKKLRILAEIINQKGERLAFQRRKGNQKTLLDAAGQDLPDNALIPYLGNVDQEYFSAMFGLGTRELREGAEQLLHGKGEIGNALFSASMGGTPIQKILAALTNESEQLFKGRSTANVSIRPTANSYKELLRKSSEASVSPDVWEKVETDLIKAIADKARLDGELSALRRDLEWISRCEDALPTVGRLVEELQKLAALPSLPDVSSDFVERSRTARKAVSDSLVRVNNLKVQKIKFEEQLAGCQTDPALLAEADALDRLHQDLGAYRQRKNTLIDLKSELDGLEGVLRSGMQTLELEGEFSDLETLRLTSAVRLACVEAADTLTHALQERAKNTEKTEDIQTQIKTLGMQLDELQESDLEPLRHALVVAAAATDANQTLSVSESEVTRLTKETKAAHKELLGAPTDLDATGNLAIPRNAVIRRFSQEMAEIDRLIKAETTKVNELGNQTKSLQAELDRMARRGELPNVQALGTARAHRDRGWDLVLAAWKGTGSKEEFVPGTPLEDAFPQAIAKADHVADKLREEAEAVAQTEEIRFKIEQAEKQKQESDVEKLQAKLKESQSAWMELWQPCEINPQSPSEMEDWREAWVKFTGLLHQWRDAEEEVLRKRTQVQEAKRLLGSTIGTSADKDFVLLNKEAIKLVQEGEQAAGAKSERANRIQGLNNQLNLLQDNAARLIAAVEVASTTWKAQCRLVGMPATISPKYGLILLQERQELLSEFDRWKKVSADSKSNAAVVLQYENAVNEMAVTLVAAGDTVETQERDLWTRLEAARRSQTRYEQLEEQIQETETHLEESLAVSAQANRELEDLVRLAKLDAAEALEPLLANLELRDKAQSQVDTFRDTLGGLARGQSVDDFIARVTAEDCETLPQRKNNVQEQIREKEATLQTQQDKLYALQEQKKTLNAAGDAAADYRQQAESCAARLKQDASRFVRLRLATHLLQTQIERFRKENQGPLLAKSGEIFKDITQGAFGGLGAEFNADDAPILVGLRTDKTTVPIPGMSDGARDQLYLALRLAALEQYLEKHEPMPLILDDLLITFDDKRAAAILPRLSDLAKRTQIFLFTHHAHLIEICRQTLDKGTFHLHQLNVL